MIEIRGYSDVDRGVAYRLSVEGQAEAAIVGHVAEAIGALAPIFEPFLIRTSLDSYLPELFGIPDDAATVDPPVTHVVAANGRPLAERFLRSASGPVVEVDAITAATTARWLNAAVSGARSTGGEGRPGISVLETLTGRARLPHKVVAGRSRMDFTNVEGRSRAIDVVDGWVEGPSEDAVVPIPLAVVVSRDAWDLHLTVEVRMDAFWPSGEAVSDELADGLAALREAGWAPFDRSA